MYKTHTLERYKFKGTNINITLLKLKSSTKVYAELEAVNTVTATRYCVQETCNASENNA